MASPETFAKRLTATHYKTQAEVGVLRQTLSELLAGIDSGNLSAELLERARALVNGKEKGE